MRTFSIISTFVVLVTTLVMVAPANAQWPQTTSHNRFSIEFGGRGLDRPGSKLAIPLITDSNTNAPLFDATDATDLGSTTAADIKVNFNSPTGREWEFRSVLAGWDEEIDPILGPNLNSPFFENGLVPDRFKYQYDSDYFSFELMAKQAVRPGIVVVFGPRLVSTKDVVRTIGEVDTQGGVFSLTNDTEATNFLMGLQSGLEINRPIVPGMYVNSYIHVGGYYNPTEVTTREINTFTAGDVSNRQTKSTGSFLGEVGARMYYDLVPNCASVYVGYDATWIDGIALAPPQLLMQNTTVPSIETANTPFFHGVSFGMKFTY